MLKKNSTKKVIFFMIIATLLLQFSFGAVCYGATPEADATYYDKGNVELFDGEPDGTGNSAGEIIFMLVIVGICLFFVVEAIVSWIRKYNKN